MGSGTCDRLLLLPASRARPLHPRPAHYLIGTVTTSNDFNHWSRSYVVTAKRSTSVRWTVGSCFAGSYVISRAHSTLSLMLQPQYYTHLPMDSYFSRHRFSRSVVVTGRRPEPADAVAQPRARGQARPPGCFGTGSTHGTN